MTAFEGGQDTWCTDWHPERLAVGGAVSADPKVRARRARKVADWAAAVFVWAVLLGGGWFVLVAAP